MTTPLGRPVAEQIAAVVADIRAGRVKHPGAIDRPGIVTAAHLLARAQRPQPVVDCTAIFHMQQGLDEINLYDDHPQVTPPWDNALLCYVNTFGNVICLQVHRRDHDGSTISRNEWVTDNEVDWARVRWIAESAIWVGGKYGANLDLDTHGPCHLFRHAIYEDGTPGDINWVSLLDRVDKWQYQVTGEDRLSVDSEPTWEAILITLGASLNFLNASNVDIAEPARPRAERRRIARTGVTVQTIVVRPPGKRRASSTAVRPLDASETVLGPVRGHWARYGPEHGRGLLFGKYAGKFWITAHVRGAGDEPDEPRNYVLKPSPRPPVS